MGSYRAIVIGPPEPVDNLVQSVCDQIHQKDRIKNTQTYEEFTLDEARKIQKLESHHQSYPYLFNFPWDGLPDYLNTLEEEGYERIRGEGIWFICYRSSPGTIIERNRSRVIQYTIEDGADGSITPFSYDPAQDFKTDL